MLMSLLSFTTEKWQNLVSLLFVDTCQWRFVITCIIPGSHEELKNLGKLYSDLIRKQEWKWYMKYHLGKQKYGPRLRNWDLLVLCSIAMDGGYIFVWTKSAAI